MCASGLSGHAACTACQSVPLPRVFDVEKLYVEVLRIMDKVPSSASSLRYCFQHRGVVCRTLTFRCIVCRPSRRCIKPCAAACDLARRSPDFSRC